LLQFFKSPLAALGIIQAMKSKYVILDIVQMFKNGFPDVISLGASSLLG
jgi:hypothetical protein